MRKRDAMLLLWRWVVLLLVALRRCLLEGLGVG